MKSMLKSLAFFCSLLLSSLANKTYSQTLPNNNPGNFGSTEHRKAYDSTLYFPTGCGIPTDTTFLFSQGFGGKGEKKKMAAKYYDSCGHKEYTWDPSSKAWHQSDGGGGGGGTVSTTNSVTGDGTGGTPVKLVGDAATPGNLKYYGTNSSGTKGFADLSALILNLGNADLTATANRKFSGAGHTLTFTNVADPAFNMTGASVGNAGIFRLRDSLKDIVLEIGQTSSGASGSKQGFQLRSFGLTSGSQFNSIIMDSGRFYLTADWPGGGYIGFGPSTTPGLNFSADGGLYTFVGVPSTTDTTKKALVYDPVFNTLSYMDLWSRAAGGGNPFADNNPLVKNNSDNTKKVIIGAANVTTSTTRTLQSPDANGTIVLNDNTATLTNKTIAAGSNTISGLTNSNLSGSAAIINANLANSSITINGVNTALGTSTSVTDATLSTSNVTTNNATTSKHGFVPILPNDATKYFDGTGNYTVPAGTDHPNSRPTSTVSAPTSFSFVAGDFIESIWVDPTSTTPNFQVGSTTGTGTGSDYDLIPTQTLSTGSLNNFVINKRVTANVTYFFQGISSSTVITILKQQ